MNNWLEKLGDKVFLLLTETGRVLMFLGATLRWTFSSPFYVKNVLKQMEVIGVYWLRVVL